MSSALTSAEAARGALEERIAEGEAAAGALRRELAVEREQRDALQQELATAKDSEAKYAGTFMCSSCSLHSERRWRYLVDFTPADVSSCWAATYSTCSFHIVTYLDFHVLIPQPRS